MPAMGIVKERAVTINILLDALVENVSDSARVECRRKLGTAGVLNAMDWPEDLFDAIEHNVVARFFAWMVCRETAVIRRMPILCCKHQFELLLHFVSNRNDFIAVRHW